MKGKKGVKKHRLLIACAGYLLIGIFILSFLELTAFLYYYVRDGSYVPVSARLERGLGNAIATADMRTDKNISKEGNACGWVDELFPHPYLGFVVHQNPPCRVQFGNKQGLIGRDFPLERESDSFNILLTGGSVAMFLGQFFQGQPLYLEEALNTCYVPPKGKSFKVYNGALGDWRQPQETVAFLLFGRAFDGLVTLEGANEYHAALRFGATYGDAQGRFEAPDTLLSQALTPWAQDYQTTTSMYLANTLSRGAKHFPVTRHSFLAYFFIDKITAILERNITRTAERDWNKVTSAASLFVLPEGWDRARVVKFNIEQYKWHLVNLHAMARAQGISSAFFLQPVPLYGKALTTEETQRVRDTSVWNLSPVSYTDMVKDLATLKSRGVPLFSLLNVFENTQETVYADPIHYIIDGVFPSDRLWDTKMSAPGRSTGYERVAKVMAEKIADSFPLKRKCH